MEFSPIVSCSNGVFEWSPNGRYLAHAVQSRLVVRDSASLKVLSSHCCLGTIEALSWSPSSEFIAAGLYSLGITSVFTPLDPTWSAKINEGAVGLEKIKFAPDSRHILATSSLGLKVTIWSLTSRQVRFVKNPKCFDFSSDGAALAVAEKTETGKDVVGIYETEDWQEVSRFETDCLDIVGLLWRPNDLNSIAVWNGVLNYILQIFNARGDCLLRFEPYHVGLGIKSVSWSPCGQVLCVGSYDEKVRIFNGLNHSLLANLSTVTNILPDDSMVGRCQVYEEKLKEIEDIDAKIVQEWLNSRSSFYEAIDKRPVTVSKVKVDVKKPNPRIGPGLLKFSPDSLFLALREDSMPSSVWIWNLQNLQLHTLLVHQDPVTGFDWDPSGVTRLVITTGGSTTFLWTPLGAVAIKLPGSTEMELKAGKALWNPLGKTLAFGSREHIICAKIVKRKAESKEH